MPGTIWTNAPLTLFHGTSSSAAQDILKNSININRCQKRSDFSQGFYTTTSRNQAVDFANRRASVAKQSNPKTTDVAALLSWNLDRDALGSQDNLVFIRPNDDYWQFISHCRNGGRPHKPAGDYPAGDYSVVYGPVSQNWQKNRILLNSDQISFHTNSAFSVLRAASACCVLGNPNLKV